MALLASHAMWTHQRLQPDRPCVWTAHDVRPFANEPLAAATRLDIPAGLSALIGGEGRGKTTLLRQLCGDTPGHVPGAFQLDLRMPHDDAHTAEQVWQRLRPLYPDWDTGLQDALTQALGLHEHRSKALYMLSTGSRRKVGLVATLASGATLTGLDQPYMALDMGSVAVLQDFLRDAAEHPSRAWLIADYEADAALPWASIIDLGA